SPRLALRTRGAPGRGGPWRCDPHVDPPPRRRGADVRSHPRHEQGRARRRPPRRRARGPARERAERGRGSVRVADSRRGADVTGRERSEWSRPHERSARTPLSSPLVLALIAGGVRAAWIGWRVGAAAVAASRAWLAGTLVAFAVAFMRVPFHLYW